MILAIATVVNNWHNVLRAISMASCMFSRIYVFKSSQLEC